ncbi:uncharacterized protein LOC124310491 [Neodiprion virginianus]|uniref:uncharacterized protein LOC124310491 n=1 Tax=Neodiprion virginianus TaxID=2961670 RepID=UPI001EE6E415|nr:uncharacterized protein LOC124310491 [Neodiprion virginianus]
MKPKLTELNDVSETMESEAESPLVTKEEVLSILSKKLSGEFELVEYKLRSLNSTNGFLGIYYGLTALVKIDGVTKEHKFFLKAQPSKQSPQFDLLMAAKATEKESAMYTEIIPRMGNGSCCSGWSAKCYLTKENVLVLDDLFAQGYVTTDKYVPFDYNHCLVVLRSLARFHAGSFIIDEKLRSENKSLFKVYGDILGESLYNDSGISTRMLSSCILGTMSLIDLLQKELSESERAEFKERVRPWGENTEELLNPSKKYRNVICHRDLWANNLMLKYDASGKPEHCCLIDLQILRYNPPATDCVYVLYLTTDRETRDKHGESLLRMYYETLERELTNAGLDSKRCLDWPTFRKSCEDTRSAAIVYAIMNLPVMLLHPDMIKKQFNDSPELLNESLYNDRSAVVCNQFLNVKPYRERLTEVLLEAYEFLPRYKEGIRP